MSGDLAVALRRHEQEGSTGVLLAGDGEFHLAYGAIASAHCHRTTGLDRLVVEAGVATPEDWRRAGAGDPSVLLEQPQLETLALLSVYDAAYFLLSSGAEPEFRPAPAHWLSRVCHVRPRELVRECERRGDPGSGPWPAELVDRAPVVPARRVHRRRVVLTAVQAEVLAAADTRRNVTEIARYLGRTTYGCLTAVRELTTLGLIEPAAGVEDSSEDSPGEAESASRPSQDERPARSEAPSPVESPPRPLGASVTATIAPPVAGQRAERPQSVPPPPEPAQSDGGRSVSAESDAPRSRAPLPGDRSAARHTPSQSELPRSVSPESAVSQPDVPLLERRAAAQPALSQSEPARTASPESVVSRRAPATSEPTQSALPETIVPQRESPLPVVARPARSAPVAAPPPRSVVPASRSIPASHSVVPQRSTVPETGAALAPAPDREEVPDGEESCERSAGEAKAPVSAPLRQRIRRAVPAAEREHWQQVDMSVLVRVRAALEELA